MAEKFRYDCQSCILLVRRIVLEKGRNSWKKWLLFTFLDWGRKVIWMLLTFFYNVDKTAISVARAPFWCFFSNCKFFSSFPSFELESSPLSDQMFRHNCHNSNLALQTKIWWKICISVEKCNSFFFKFWSAFKKVCRTIGGKVPQGRESCILFVRWIFLKTKQLFWATCFFFIFLWLRAEKNLTFEEIFSALLTKNCVRRLQSTAPTWCFFEHFSVFSPISIFEN